MSRSKKDNVTIHLPDERKPARIPPEARERLGDGGTHRDKKHYNRKDKHKGKDE